MPWRPEGFVFPEAGACRASIGMASPGTGVIDVAAVTNPRGNLFGPRSLACLRWSGNWSSPSYLAGRLRDAPPVAISRTPNVTDVFAVGADNDDGAMLTWWNVGGTWNGPQRLGGSNGLLS